MKRPTGNERRFFLDTGWHRALTAGVIALLLLAVAYTTIAFREQYHIVREESRLLIAEVERLRALLDQATRFPGLSAAERRTLEREGLEDPAAELTEDLMRHPELIPYEGVLGGRMGFQTPANIRVLSSRWVVAQFDDGHISGKMLLRYSVDDGRISWKVIDAYLE